MLAELRELLGLVGREAEHGDAGGRERVERVAEVARLRGAARASSPRGRRRGRPARPCGPSTRAPRPCRRGGRAAGAVSPGSRRTVTGSPGRRCGRAVLGYAEPSQRTAVATGARDPASPDRHATEMRPAPNWLRVVPGGNAYRCHLQSIRNKSGQVRLPCALSDPAVPPQRPRLGSALLLAACGSSASDAESRAAAGARHRHDGRPHHVHRRQHRRATAPRCVGDRPRGHQQPHVRAAAAGRGHDGEGRHRLRQRPAARGADVRARRGQRQGRRGDRQDRRAGAAGVGVHLRLLLPEGGRQAQPAPVDRPDLRHQVRRRHQGHRRAPRRRERELLHRQPRRVRREGDRAVGGVEEGPGDRARRRPRAARPTTTPTPTSPRRTAGR